MTYTRNGLTSTAIFTAIPTTIQYQTQNSTLSLIRPCSFSKYQRNLRIGGAYLKGTGNLSAEMNTQYTKKNNEHQPRNKTVLGWSVIVIAKKYLELTAQDVYGHALEIGHLLSQPNRFKICCARQRIYRIPSWTPVSIAFLAIRLNFCWNKKTKYQNQNLKYKCIYQLS